MVFQQLQCLILGNAEKDSGRQRKKYVQRGEKRQRRRRIEVEGKRKEGEGKGEG
jgi:hypothetical protein